MKWLVFEWRLLARSRLSMFALALLMALTSLGVGLGLHEVARQHETIARLAPLQAQDVAAIASVYAKEGDAGYAAYYTPYLTWDAPSSTAFLALGLRDVAPYVLRIRALGLQGQLYEGETFNPELALPGKFDFAFVLIYLAPLFVIALLHDLLSSERQSGRLRMLMAMPGAGGRLWVRRAALRIAALMVCLGLPVVASALYAGTPGMALLAVLLTALAYVLFWGGLSLLIGARAWSSTANATALMACWAALTLVLPTASNAMLSRTLPVHQGVDLILAQRQNINAGWDQPRDETMQRFFVHHPEFRDTAQLPVGFHWKWYYAFHQLGDESVAEKASAYRAGLQARQRWTSRLGWILPGVGAQVALHRIAATDLQAQLAYQSRISALHQDMRHFYYPYVFNDKAFAFADFERRPRYQPGLDALDVPLAQLGMLLLVSLTLAAAGLATLRRVRIDR